MLDMDIPCHVLSTKSLIKTTGVCIIKPKKGSKFSPILVNDIAEKYCDSVEECSNFHVDEQVPDSFPSHLVCIESTRCNNRKSRRLRTVISPW